LVIASRISLFPPKKEKSQKERERDYFPNKKQKLERII
jgi:hypothetical protein